MSKCYKKPFLKSVILKVDFSANFEIPTKGLPKKVSNEILKLFPIPEPKEVVTKEIRITNEGTKEIRNKQNHLFFHGISREKTLGITPDSFFMEIKKYETYDKLKNEFNLIVDLLSEIDDFSIKRFGLRFINNIELGGGDFLEWGEFFEPNLLGSFEVPEDKTLLSRVFTNVVQQFEDNMIMNFQYGMHNPDFPSKIRRKIFILDFDSYYQGLLTRDEIKRNVDIAHKRIEELFEKSITPKLRELMVEEIEE